MKIIYTILSLFLFTPLISSGQSADEIKREYEETLRENAKLEQTKDVKLSPFKQAENRLLQLKKNNSSNLEELREAHEELDYYTQQKELKNKAKAYKQAIVANKVNEADKIANNLFYRYKELINDLDHNPSERKLLEDILIEIGVLKH